MKWSDFTNKFLGILGKYVMLPLVIIGSILILMGAQGIGILILFGGCLLFLLATIGLVIFKPVLLKKYPKKQTKQTQEKCMVDPSIPHDQLSPIQKLAVEHCGGDVEAAFGYLLTHMDKNAQEAYTKDLTQKESMAAMRFLNTKINGNYSKKAIQQMVNEEAVFAHLEMTREQISVAEKNPFVRKLWISITILLLGNIMLGLIVGFGRVFLENGAVIETIASFLGCVITFLAFRVVTAIMNVFRFRNAKRIISKENLCSEQ